MISDLVSLIFFCVVAGWILGCFLIGLAWVFVMLFWIGLDRELCGICVWKFLGSWCVGFSSIFLSCSSSFSARSFLWRMVGLVLLISDRVLCGLWWGGRFLWGEKEIFPLGGFGFGGV